MIKTNCLHFKSILWSRSGRNFKHCGTLWYPSGQIDPGHICGFKIKFEIKVYFINHCFYLNFKQWRKNMLKVREGGQILSSYIEKQQTQ